MANQRFRHQGRFIKKEELDKFDLNEIFDPRNRANPKTKQIFKVIREARITATSSGSSKYFDEAPQADDCRERVALDEPMLPKSLDLMKVEMNQVDDKLINIMRSLNNI